MIPDKVQRFIDETKRKLLVFKSPEFVFEQEQHVYTYSGKKLDSVTTFLKTFKTPFDKEYWSAKKAVELGKTKEEILNEWKGKADTATNLGTLVHEWIEKFWDGENPEYPENEEVLSRVMKFKSIYESKLKNFYPIGSEIKIFSRIWGLAGTIDGLFAFYDEKQDEIYLVIGDWKTNGSFTTDSHPKGRYKKLLRPFSDLYENNLSEYSIQLSLYRAILEQSSIKTHSSFLCHIGPEGDAKIYRSLDLKERLQVYLDENRKNSDIFSLD